MKRKRERNELMEFFGGSAMLTGGLYLFSNEVTVTSSFFGGRIMIGNFEISSGLCIVPFLIGIFIMFADPDSLIGKFIAAMGVVVIITAVIASTRLHLPRISLYEWLLYLVLIVGGFGLVARVLFAKPKDEQERIEEDK